MWSLESGKGHAIYNSELGIQRLRRPKSVMGRARATIPTQTTSPHLRPTSSSSPPPEAATAAATVATIARPEARPLSSPSTPLVAAMVTMVLSTTAIKDTRHNKKSARRRRTTGRPALLLARRILRVPRCLQPLPHGLPGLFPLQHQRDGEHPPRHTRPQNRPGGPARGQPREPPLLSLRHNVGISPPRQLHRYPLVHAAHLPLSITR
jgi:hypothetical protein